MSGPLRWGIAATGGIARSMVAALAGLDDAVVTAVASRDQQRADSFAAEFGIGTAHGSYHDLYVDDDVDIVYVATPHHLHHEMTIAALDAGKHVLCEKAFALNARQAGEMIEAARRNDRFLMEAMWTWCIPAVVHLRDRLRDGVIGRIVDIDADFALRVDDEDGRHRRLDLGGGALLDLGIYPLTFASFLVGEHPAEVRVLGTLSDAGVDVGIGGVARFTDTTIATFRTSLDGTSSMSARITGTDGRIDVSPPFWFATDYTIHRDGSDVEHVHVPNRGLAHEAAHAMDRIRGGHLQSDVITWDATLATMRLLDEVRRQVGVLYPAD